MPERAWLKPPPNKQKPRRHGPHVTPSDAETDDAPDGARLDAESPTKK
jgi:hypothetical protein